MASYVMQIRIDEQLRNEASEVYEKLGIDIPTAVRMFLKRSVLDNGIPFSMKLDKEPENRAIAAMKAASRIAEEHGISEMTLDEINAEIAEARK